MAMDEDTLATELEGMTPTDTEATAIDTLTEAYATFAADAESNAVGLEAAGLELGKTAFKAALTGMSASGAAIVSIPAACVAFWAAVALGLATSFPGATAIVPPPHATLAAEFAALMPQNVIDEVTLAQAAADIAAMMYTNATTSGTVTFPGPTTAPIE